MIERVVIPAAGKGTRMLDLAEDRPKHLIDVLDRPFLYYVLKNLQKAGFEEMILVIGHHAERMVKFAETDGKEFPITIVNQFEVIGTERYGTAIPVLAARESLGNDGFVCIYGDNLYSPCDLAAIRLLDAEYSFVSLRFTETPEKFGVAVMKDVVNRIVEKPKQFISNWVAIGGYKFTAEIFPECEKVGLSERGEYKLTDAITTLAIHGKVRARKILDYWLDFGEPEDVENLIRVGKL